MTEKQETLVGVAFFASWLALVSFMGFFPVLFVVCACVAVAVSLYLLWIVYQEQNDNV